MSTTINFIISIIKIAIFIGIMGDLTAVTRIMLGEATKAHQHRSISFKKMNQMLVGK